MHTKEFIQKYICKSGETIEQLSQNEWQIQKWTARTFKTMGNVLAEEQYDQSPVEEIKGLKLKPHSRRNSLPLSEKIIQEGLYKGWIIQEIRFKKDGRTPADSVYRMGPGLFIYERLRSEKVDLEDRELKQILLKELENSKGTLPNDF
ncbi:hypothetical protein ACA30_09870 [Virgibacillus soli]|nr:hypothetical protein ACA30_09870 [Virgibacillus soli]